jgi:hypothetical protein
MSFQIKYFVKNATTNAAFRDKKFYGVGSTGQPYSSTGYPNAAGTTAGPYDLTPHEIQSLEDSAINATFTNTDATVTVASSLFDSSFVGAYLYDLTNVETPVFKGVVASVTNDTTVELTAAATATATFNLGYMKSGTTNFLNFRPAESFYILISVEDPTSATSIFPSVRGCSTSYSTSTRIGEADNTLVALNRVSAEGIPATSASPVDVPLTIKRVNDFIGGNSVNTYFKTNNDKPLWVCWEVNPYGESSTSLSRYTRYEVNVLEALQETNVATGFTYSSAEEGYI